jgi:general L-amino acid transport system substrate-binding protein
MMRFVLGMWAGVMAMLMAGSAGAATLDTVKARGVLVCGGNGELPGFGLADAEGHWSGLDVDFCRAIAAAIFNDATKVKFVPVAERDRFTALQAGDVDVLVRNTTWTLSRDAALGLSVAGVNYYDGQGFIVRRASRLNSALQLDNVMVCVLQGTTTELNLADYFAANRLRLKSMSFATFEEAVQAYDAGRCNAFSADASSLYGARLKLAKAADHVVLPEIISKEPLGPFVRRGDEQWFDIVRWVHFAMLDAEELNVNQANLDQQAHTDSAEVKRLLGSEGKVGEQLGLTDDWAYRIIRLVGNYGEVFERNVGQGSPLKIARGLNALWTKGGIQYAPPIR